MPAVVRIKRRIDEEPLSAFVLNSKKRRRLENGVADNIEALRGAGDAASAMEKEEISTILKFAGTIQEQDNSATTQLARLNKEAATELVRQKSARAASNHTARARQEMRQAMHESRFKVVNCMRTTLDEEDHHGDAGDGVNSKEVTILDIEKERKETAYGSGGNGKTMAEALTAQQQHQQEQQQRLQQATDSDMGYVYDLYLPEQELQVEPSDMTDDNYLSIRPFDDLVYEDRFNDDDDEDANSEDSNDENYFANDYPDEDEDDEAGNGRAFNSFEYNDVEGLEGDMQRLHFGYRNGYITHFESADSSVASGDSDSSDDDADYYYAEDGDDNHRRRHRNNDDGDDDDVDYYDAHDESDHSD